MIQRIQTIYLLLAAGALAAFVGLSSYWETPVALLGNWAELAALGLAAFGAFIALVAVFFYKERAKQLRLAVVSQWIDLGLILLLVAAMGFVSFGTDGEVSVGPATYAVVALPIVAYIFIRLGGRGIQRDIEKVRSMDRLR
ncbi:MAG: DUF4293 family protein [Rubricoccaceae bacterium]|nr:DUF4293 family protein [Rubricoccaceae bacterium]